MWTQIDAGNGHSCGVTSLGKRLCWGHNDMGQTNVPVDSTASALVATVQGGAVTFSTAPTTHKVWLFIVRFVAPVLLILVLWDVATA